MLNLKMKITKFK